MSNTVAFPSEAAPRAPAPLALSVYHTTALEVCELVYGAAPPTRALLERLYEPSAVYENPLVAASSRAALADLHALSGALARLDVPRPAALLRLLGLVRGGGGDEGEGEGGEDYAWFRALRMRHEVTDVCESESFDGHKRVIVEHILHIALLPALAGAPPDPDDPPPTPDHLSLSLSGQGHVTGPTSFGTDLRAALWQLRPSLLRLRLPIITRLAFNDAGQITHHRDFWDVKDVLNLIPGMSLAQWVATRLVAHSVRGAFAAGRALLAGARPGARGKGWKRAVPDEERGIGGGL